MNADTFGSHAKSEQHSCQYPANDTIPDMEEFAKAPMLDLTVLWWPIRSFAVTTMFGANAVQCTVIGNTEIKFEQDVPERVTMLNEARTWKYVVLDIVRAYQKQHPQNNT